MRTEIADQRASPARPARVGARRLLLRRVMPGVLLALAAGTAFLAGTGTARPDSPLPSLLQALFFATCVLLGVGAHAVGHFVVARRHGVDASFPYFVPQIGITGTAGAYVKMPWPIEDRRALVRIFAAGPIAGFVVSTAIVFIGMALSTTTVRPTEGLIELGDSLITFAAQHILFPGLPKNEAVVAHPLLVAGILGLHFSFWQLLPAGRFDGGRVVYALFGHKRAIVISWLTIAGLVLLSLISPGWFGYAAFASLTMIRLERQHPAEGRIQQLDRHTIALACVMAVLLVLTFVPIPVRLTP